MRYGSRALAVLLLLVLVIIGTVVAVVLSGPTEIPFIRSRVQSMLQTALGSGYKVDVGRAVIDVDPVLGLVVEIDQVDIHDGSNVLVAHAPSTRFAIDPLALLRFRLSVSTIEVASPEVALVRSEQGAVYLGNAKTPYVPLTGQPAQPLAKAAPANEDGGFPEVFAAVHIVDRALEPAVAAAVKAGFLHFSLVDGTIEVWDAERAQERRFLSTDVSASVDPDSGALKVSFASSGYGGRWTATVNRDVDKATGDRSVSAMFSQLTIADLFPKLGEPSSLLTADIPLYGRATVRLDAAGDIEDAMLRLDLGAGTIRFGENHDTVLLDEATLKLHWDVQNKMVVVDQSPFYFGNTRGTVTGWIRRDGNPEDRHYAFQLESQDATLDSSDANAPPIVADRIAVSGSADLAGKLIKLDNATIQSHDASISAAGSIAYGGDQPTTAIAASFSPMDLLTLKQMWIPFIAPGARRWVMQHVLGGRLAEGKFDAAVPTAMLFSRQKPAIPEDQLQLSMRLEDVAFTTYGELPPVLHASGNLVLAGQTFGLDVDGAEVRVPSGAKVDVTAGAFAIANAFQHGPEGDIELELSGDASAIGEIADAKPFMALSRRQITPSDLSGKADVSVSVKMPLLIGMTESDVDWKVTVNATGLASKTPVEGRTFSDANVVISATPDEVAINGKAKIDGVPADVRMSQPLTTGGVAVGPGARYARLTLDDAARKRLGIGLDQILGGSVGAVISNIEDGSKGQHYDLDLKHARLVVPGLGWSKATGVPAQLSFDIKPADDGYSIENIALTGSGFGFTGKAKLDSTYGLISADIDQFALRPGDSVAFSLTRTKTGYTIAARGTSFDVRGFITHLRDLHDSDDSFPDISIDARLDRMTGFNQEVINAARLTLTSTGGDLQKLSFAGSIGDSAIVLNYSDLDDGTTLSARCNDAGRLFRFMDFYSRISGGQLNVAGQSGGGSDALAGTFEVDGFDVLNEPALQRVVSSRGAPGAIDTGHVHFDRLFARYHLQAGSITIDDALVRGNSVGATFNGSFDLGASQVAINGTYVPAYALNNALSRIPLIGLVLTGGVSEGLIGVTFRIEGPIDDPRLFINPLSAVTPGIFRKIFEFH